MGRGGDILTRAFGSYVVDSIKLVLQQTHSEIFQMISNCHWFISVKISDNQELPVIFEYSVLKTKNSGQWNRKLPVPTTKFESLHSQPSTTINHHSIASRTAGCAFLTSGGKRPTMAPAMAKATGGNLDDGTMGWHPLNYQGGDLW